LLCRALAATGVAGCPREYFLAEDPAKLPDWRFWELSSPDGYEQTIRGVLAHLGLADYQGPVPALRPAVNPTT
jgi:hypothetical protein